VGAHAVCVHLSVLFFPFHKENRDYERNCWPICWDYSLLDIQTQLSPKHACWNSSFFSFSKKFLHLFCKTTTAEWFKSLSFFFFFFNRNKTIEECLIRKFGNHSGLTPGLYFCKEKPPLYQATSRTVGVS
jgi:hypothetical protein